MITEINLDANKMNEKERADKLGEVAWEMHQILNSTMFRDKVMKMVKTGETSQYRDKSNKEVYERLMSGADRHDETEDNVIHLYVDDYYTFKKVIGYTLLSSKYIRVNTKYFDRRSNKLVGSNLIHEYGHLVGFSHDYRRTSRRANSICYLLNDIYEECHDRLIGPREGSLVKVKTGGFWKFSKYAWVRK